MIGGQTSLEIGIAAALIATLFGVLWGAVAGFFGGWVDNLLMRFVDIMLAIPALFLLLFLAVAFPRNVLTLILVVSVTAWLIPARLVRAEALTLRTREYVQAVTMMGGGGFRIVLRHIIPNSVGTIMVNATFQVADAILLVAAVNYLGLGIAPPATNWGAMLSGRHDLHRQRLVVVDLPRGPRDRAHGRRLQLHRRCAARRARGAAPEALTRALSRESHAAVLCRALVRVLSPGGPSPLCASTPVPVIGCSSPRRSPGADAPVAVLPQAPPGRGSRNCGRVNSAVRSVVASFAMRGRHPAASVRTAPPIRLRADAPASGFLSVGHDEVRIIEPAKGLR